MEIRNAVIKGASLQIEDHGILTVYLGLDYGGVHQSFGGYGLYYPKNPDGDTTGQFLWKVFQVLEVRDFDELTGKPVRVKIEDGLIRSIGHYIKDLWFTPREDLK